MAPSEPSLRHGLSWPVAAIFFGYLIYVYNKKTLIYQYPALLAENRWTARDAGLISSAQQLSISAVTLATGFWPGDGRPDYPRWLFIAGLVWTGITTLVLPYGPTENVWYFAAVWFANGIGHGLQLTAALSLTKQFSQPDTFGTNWSLVAIAVNLAGIINPIVAGYLRSATADRTDWRTAVGISGTITLATGLAMFYLLPKPNQTTTMKKEPKRKNEIKFRSTFPALVWLVAGNRFMVAICRITVQEWSQLYFTTELGWHPYRSGLFLTTMEMASIVGKLLAGRLNDYAMKRWHRNDAITNTTTMIRLPIAIILQLLSGISLWLYCYWLPSSSTTAMAAPIAVAIMIGMATAGNVITLSVWSAEIGTGTAASSVCATGTKIGTLTSGYPFTVLTEHTGSWQRSYLMVMVAIAGTVGLDLWWFYYRCRYRSMPKQTKQCLKRNEIK